MICFFLLKFELFRLNLCVTTVPCSRLLFFAPSHDSARVLLFQIKMEIFFLKHHHGFIKSLAVEPNLPIEPIGSTQSFDVILIPRSIPITM